MSDKIHVELSGGAGKSFIENIDAINILWQVGPKAPTGLMCLAPVEGTAG